MTTQEAIKQLRALAVPTVNEILDQIDAESEGPPTVEQAPNPPGETQAPSSPETPAA